MTEPTTEQTPASDANANPERIVADEGAKLDFSRDMSYGDYLHLDAILHAQHPPVAGARRDAVHRAAPDQRAVDEADAARAGSGHALCGRRTAAKRLQDAGAREPHPGATGERLERPGHHDAARVHGHPPLSGQLQRLSERAVPLHRGSRWATRTLPCSSPMRTSPSCWRWWRRPGVPRRCTTWRYS